MTPAEVGQVVIDRVDDLIANAQRNVDWAAMRSALLVWFDALDEQLAFAGMLWVIENSGRYQHQLLAGELLSGRALRLQVPPEEFVRRVATRLNASAHSVVHYLEKALGRDAALRAVRAVDATDTDPGTRARLDAIRYWLGDHPKGG